MKAISAVLMLGLALACGGGGGGSSSGGSPPTIVSFGYAPTSALYKQNGGSVPVAGTLTFSDPDGDITTLRLTTPDGVFDTPIQGVSGIKSGTLEGGFQVGDTQVGHFTFQVALLDSMGHVSNSYSCPFDVIADDSAASWSQHPVPAALSAETFRGVAWSGSTFVAVGTHGAIVRSADGSTWTQCASPTGAGLFRAVWAGTQFVAVGDQGTILTSPDGAAWTQRRSTGVAGDILYGVAWSGARLVAVGVTQPGAWITPVALYSADGTSWAAAATPANVLTFPDSKLFDVASSGPNFQAVGDGTCQQI